MVHIFFKKSLLIEKGYFHSQEVVHFAGSYQWGNRKRGVLGAMGPLGMGWGLW